MNDELEATVFESEGLSEAAPLKQEFFDDEGSAEKVEEVEESGLTEQGLENPPKDEISIEPDKEDRFNTKEQTLSEEELDQIADTAIEAIRKLLAYFDAEDAVIDEYEGDDGELILDIIGENLAILIGRHGKTLEAFQFVISSIVTKNVGYRYPVVVDIEGYKNRRKQKLQELAKSSAARAIRQKREVRLRPMTPYERRIIHITLRNDRRVATRSEGDEPNRLIVIEAT